MFVPWRGGLILLAAALCAGCANVMNGGPRVGSMAPEIQGIDADGVSFKLSDYHGKVVLLDFWSST